MHYRQDLHDLIEPAVNAAGYELLGLQFIAQGKFSLLRIFIDSPDGISVDDCEKASKQISALLDVEDPINGEYTLEVSSPGIERPLFSPLHYQKAIGSEAKVTVLSPINGQKKFQGIIEAVDDNHVILNTAQEQVELPFNDIAKAHLVVKL